MKQVIQSYKADELSVIDVPLRHSSLAMLAWNVVSLVRRQDRKAHAGGGEEILGKKALNQTPFVPCSWALHRRKTKHHQKHVFRKYLVVSCILTMPWVSV